MQIQEFIRAWEQIFPPLYQEHYDNCGLLVGEAHSPLKGILLCLDCTEAIVEEAERRGCNLILAHHPLIFKGLKRLTGGHYVERTAMLALRKGIAIYACHTNADNLPLIGVNRKIADKLGLQDCQVLMPMKGQVKLLQVQVPLSHRDSLLQALWAAGAGRLGRYDQSFEAKASEAGFRPLPGAKPAEGEIGQDFRAAQVQLDLVFLPHLQGQILRALEQAHPYEQPAYRLLNLDNSLPELGGGMIGNLPQAMPVMDFLQQLKQRFGCGAIRYTQPHKAKVQRIALCGGAGEFMLGAAKAQGADVFVSSDFKYHGFFEADGRIVIADIGHYESEQFTGELFLDIISEKFPNFAVYLTEQSTNPVNYL